MQEITRDPISWRYPAIEPYRTGKLDVSSKHSLYFEESGNPHGKPALFLHGGPGGGVDAWHRTFFDPRRYRIVLFDQRGAGKSTPYASLEDNTTWHLVEDIETLRRHLKIDKWQVFGGSWGSTLALSYAVTHPGKVSELVLRGIFLGDQREIDWLYQGGAQEIFPEGFQAYSSVIPASERGNMVQAFYKRLTGNDTKEQGRAAVAWSTWEGQVSKLLPDAGFVAHYENPEFAIAFARIEAHYFVNRCFMPKDGHLLSLVDKIRHIPAVIVQGRYDICCPPRSAWELHKAWPEADLVIVPDAGHSAGEPGNSRALVAATDRFAWKTVTVNG